MIVSHKNKFIFIKPRKVAGTSIEINLAKECGKDDIITPITKFSKKSDKTKYEQKPRNYFGYYNHMKPEKIKKKVGKKVWKEYFKFTVIRNPWDLFVSYYEWETFCGKKEFYKNITFQRVLSRINDFESYKKLLKQFVNKMKNEKNGKTDFEKFIKEKKDDLKGFCFDNEGNPYCDFYVKFENLNTDYKKACKKIGIRFNELPITKKIKDKKSEYRTYYNDKTKKMIEQFFKNEIEQFNYKF